MRKTTGKPASDDWLLSPEETAQTPCTPSQTQSKPCNKLQKCLLSFLTCAWCFRATSRAAVTDAGRGVLREVRKEASLSDMAGKVRCEWKDSGSRMKSSQNEGNTADIIPITAWLLSLANSIGRSGGIQPRRGGQQLWPASCDGLYTFLKILSSSSRYSEMPLQDCVSSPISQLSSPENASSAAAYAQSVRTQVP
jgi:hypothetical protein